ncbi:histidine kinase N-terminal 7TM domain-containing protein [Roseovarius indicus]|uniref:histidine kinase N-terminal 7TM domain-containing protein n=1 Tax=Roseovarius indicus TaxID=540747 RepID=UPI0032EB0673
MINAALMIFCILFLGGRTFFNGKPFLILTCAAMFWWLVSAGMEIQSTTLKTKTFWASAAWPAIATVPVTWFFFLYNYSFSVRSDRDPRVKALILAVLVGVMTVTGTNAWHGLFYGAGTSLEVIDGRLSADFDHGPLFYVCAAVLYVFLAAAVGILGYASNQAKRMYRPFFRALFVVTIVPVAGNIGYLVYDITIFGFDPTPFLFSAVVTLFVWLLIVSRVLNLDSIGKEVLFLSNSDGIIVLDTDGIVWGANEPATALLGADLTREGASMRGVGPIWEYLEENLGRDSTLEPRIIRLNDRYYDTRMVPIFRPLHIGRLTMGWVLTLRDTTEMLDLSRRLETERDRLQSLMENSEIGIFLISETGDIVYANPEAEKITGLSSSEITSRGYRDEDWRNETLDGRPMAAEDLPVSIVLRTGEKVTDMRHALILPNGERRVLSVNAVPVEMPEGMQVVCSVSDVTAQEAAADFLRQARDRAEAANAAKTQFLSNMSHEIRTPLNGVLGMAELLSHTDLNEEQRRHLQVLRESGEGLVGILEDLLDMAKLETETITLAREAFTPNGLAERLDSQFSAKAEDKGLDFELYISGDGDTVLTGDPKRILQIGQHLIGNAIKFTARGHVTVTMTLTRDGALELCVEDTGAGICDEDLDRVFKPFTQADESRTRRHGGTGLGLAVVARLVDLMQGHIETVTEPGKGTKITVTLPSLQG